MAGSSIGVSTARLMLDISDFSRNLSQARKEAQKFPEQVNSKFSQSYDNVAGSLRSAGSALTQYMTVPIAGAATWGLKISSGFEEGMSAVKAITQASERDFEGLREVAKQLGQDTKFSASEVADGMTVMAKAGWNAKQIMSGMEGVLDAAAASGEDLSTVSEVMAITLTGFNIAAEDSTHVADVLTQVANAGTVDITDLGESFKYCSAQATMTKVPFEDVSQALLAMSRNGIKGSQAGTSMRRILQNLAHSSEQADKALEGLNYSAWDSQGNFKGMSTVLSDLRKKFSTLTTEEQNYYASKVAGSTGMSAFLSLLNMTDEEYNQLAVDIGNCNGVAKDTAETMQDNLANQFEQLKGSLETLAINLGEIIVPKLREFVKWLEGVVDWFANLDPGVQTAILGAVGFAAALGPLLKLFGNIMTIAKPLITILGGGGASGLAGGFSTLMGAIGPIAAVVGVLVAAFKHLWDTSEGFRNAISGIFDAIKDTLGRLVEGIQERLEPLGQAFQNIINFVQPIWDAFCNFLAPVFIAAFDLISNTLQVVTDVILGILDVFIGLFTGDWDRFWQGLSGIVSGVFNFIMGILQGALDLFVGLIKGAWDLICSIFGQVAGFFGGIWDAICKGLSDFGKFWSDTWKGVCDFFGDIVNNIANFFKDLGGKIVDFISSIPGKIANFFSDILGKVASWGSDMVGKGAKAASDFVGKIVGFFTGLPGKIWGFLSDALGKVGQWASDFAGKALNCATEFGNKLRDGFHNLLGALGNIGRSLVEGIWNGIAGAGNWIRDKVGGFFSGIGNNIKRLFGIKSPSRWMRDQIGKNLVLGLGVGFDDYAPGVFSGIENTLSDEVNKLNADTPSIGLEAEVDANERWSTVLLDGLDAFGDRLSLILADGANIGAKVDEVTALGMGTVKSSAYVGKIGANGSVGAYGGIDYKALSNELANVLRDAPISVNTQLDVSDGDIILDGERVGRKLAPTMTRLLSSDTMVVPRVV